MKESKFKQYFFEEAQEYLTTLEQGLRGMGDRSFASQDLEPVYRAIHSLKGTSGMVGENTLSDLSRMLEDTLKVLKTTNKIIDLKGETLLLKSVSYLSKLVDMNCNNAIVDRKWLEEEVMPMFSQLGVIFGTPEPETTVPLELPSEEVEQDLKVLLFEGEVENCLQELESIIAAGEVSPIKEKLSLVIRQLGGLGMMLELEAFSSLCTSVEKQLEAAPEEVEAIASRHEGIAVLALESWRESQALVLAGKIQQLPRNLEYKENQPVEMEEDLDWLSVIG